MPFDFRRSFDNLLFYFAFFYSLIQAKYRNERPRRTMHALHDTVTAPMHSTLRCGRSGCREEYTAAHGLTALAREEQKRFKHIDGYIKLCVE
jgi:hypothetical protein